jgi:hypothetical protein
VDHHLSSHHHQVCSAVDTKHRHVVQDSSQHQTQHASSKKRPGRFTTHGTEEQMNQDAFDAELLKITETRYENLLKVEREHIMALRQLIAKDRNALVIPPAQLSEVK